MWLYFKRYLKLFIVVFGLFIASSNYAQAQGTIFTVHGISVDQTSINSVEAKKAAIKDGRQKAFMKLASRFLEEQQINSIIYDEYIVSSLIKSYEVKQEELSNIRYVANLTFYFKEQETYEYFEAIAQRKLIKNNPDPVLIIPIMRHSNISLGSVFWGGNNPWYNEWKKHDLKDSFVPLRLPLGDLSDMQIAPEINVLQHYMPSIKQLMQRHQATKVILVVFEAENMDMDHGLLHIYETLNNKKMQHIKTIKVSGQTMDKENIFSVAIKNIISYVESSWEMENRKINLNNENNINNESSYLVASISFVNIGQWIKIQKRLRNSFTIQEMEIMSLGSNIAKVKLKYRGTVDQLRLSLQDEDLELYLPVLSLSGGIDENIYEIQIRTN